MDNWTSLFLSLQYRVHENGSNDSLAVAGSDALLVSGGCQLSDLSLCLLHGSDSVQPFLCGPQSSGK